MSFALTTAQHFFLAGTLDLVALAHRLELPALPEILKEFIHDQLHAGNPDPPEFNPATALPPPQEVSIFNSAAASFYAPSDFSGIGGMRREHIRSVQSWRGGGARRDCVFVNMGADHNEMDGLAIARVLCFFSFKHRTSYFPCAAVHWYNHVLDGRHPDNGMYVVSPSTNGGTADISIIHVDCILRTAHLILVYGPHFVPRAISPNDSYNVFRSYYVNKYADHHAFEIA